MVNLTNVSYLLSRYAQSKAAAVSIQRIDAASKDEGGMLPAIAFSAPLESGGVVAAPFA